MSDQSEAEKKETWGQLVRRYLPLATGRDCDFILWNLTPYPCWDPTEELQRLAGICAPVRKRAWYRKMLREAAHVDAEMCAMAKEVAAKAEGRS